MERYEKPEMEIVNIQNDVILSSDDDDSPIELPALP